MVLRRLLLRSRLRPRSAAAVVASLGAAAAAVIVNQPGVPSRSVHSAVAEATVAPAAPLAGGGDATSGLRVLHATVAFHAGPGRAGAPAVRAATGLLVDADTGEVLWQLSPDTPRPPASTAKIFSSLVALENLDPSRAVTVTPDALHQAPDETRLGIQAGDRYTVKELLQAMLMISANDAATALAVDTVGVDRFVQAMNEQAEALGLRHSHFMSPVGLDSPGTYTSASDLAAAAIAAYDTSPLFRELVGTRDVDVPAEPGHIAYSLHNISRIMRVYPPAVGIKPGWTGSAGFCLVAMAIRDGHRLVTVVLDDDRMVEDARALLEWGFGQEGIPPLPTATPAKPAR